MVIFLVIGAVQPQLAVLPAVEMPPGRGWPGREQRFPFLLGQSPGLTCFLGQWSSCLGQERFSPYVLPPFSRQMRRTGQVFFLGQVAYGRLGALLET